MDSLEKQPGQAGGPSTDQRCLRRPETPGRDRGKIRSCEPTDAHESLRPKCSRDLPHPRGHRPRLRWLCRAIGWDHWGRAVATLSVIDYLALLFEIQGASGGGPLSAIHASIPRVVEVIEIHKIGGDGVLVRRDRLR